MERSSSEEVIPSEAAVLINPRRDQNPNPNSTVILSPLRPEWPTIDGPLGLSEQDSVGYARKFFGFGFLLLPLLWAVNCYYFWPVLRHSTSFPRIRPCKLIDFYDILWKLFRFIRVSHDLMLEMSYDMLGHTNVTPSVINFRVTI